MAGNGAEFGPCPHCGRLHPEDVLLCPTSEKLLPLEGRLLDGKFRFTKRLGEGGMGAVWMCENILVKRTVAIKLMHVQFSRDEGVLARFRNEATAAGRIGSKHICDILDLGKSSLGPYIVMEMLQGSDFAVYVQRHAPVEPGLVVMVVRQALIGLQAAHEAGIVHRDLKPENIFMHEPEPGHLRVKLMDFGISKFTEGSEAGKTGMGVLMGTPEYMSPEQTEGAAQVDARTDLWAMGVILYWALAGRNPFVGPTMAATLMNVAMREPAPLGQLAPHLPEGLAAVVHRCMAKDPDQRFRTAQELSAALAPFERSEGHGFVPFVSHAGGAVATPPPGGVRTQSPPAGATPTGTVAMPQGYPPPAFQPSAVPSRSTPTPAGADTFSNEINLARSPTTLSGGNWDAVGADLDERPQSNIGGGGKGMLMGMIAAVLLVLGAGSYVAFSQMADDEEPTSVVADPESAEDPATATPTGAGASTPSTPPNDAQSPENGEPNAETGGTEKPAAVEGSTEGERPSGGEGGETPATEDAPEPSETEKPATTKPRVKRPKTRPSANPRPKEDKKTLSPSKPPRTPTRSLSPSRPVRKTAGGD